MEAAKRREKYSAVRNVTVSQEEVGRSLLEAVRSTQFEGVTVRTHLELQSYLPVCSNAVLIFSSSART